MTATVAALLMLSLCVMTTFELDAFLNFMISHDSTDRRYKTPAQNPKVSSTTGTNLFCDNSDVCFGRPGQVVRGDSYLSRSSMDHGDGIDTTADETSDSVSSVSTVDYKIETSAVGHTADEKKEEKYECPGECLPEMTHHDESSTSSSIPESVTESDVEIYNAVEEYEKQVRDSYVYMFNRLTKDERQTKFSRIDLSIALNEGEVPMTHHPVSFVAHRLGYLSMKTPRREEVMHKDLNVSVQSWAVSPGWEELAPYIDSIRGNHWCQVAMAGKFDGDRYRLTVLVGHSGSWYNTKISKDMSHIRRWNWKPTALVVPRTSAMTTLAPSAEAASTSTTSYPRQVIAMTLGNRQCPIQWATMVLSPSLSPRWSYLGSTDQGLNVVLRYVHREEARRERSRGVYSGPLNRPRDTPDVPELVPPQ